MVNLPLGQEIQGSLGVRCLLLRSILQLVRLNGLSIVALDVGGHKEIIQHNKTGVLFTEGSAVALAQSLLGLLNSPALWPLLRANGREYVENVRNWKNSVANYVEPYQRLVSK